MAKICTIFHDDITMQRIRPLPPAWRGSGIAWKTDGSASCQKCCCTHIRVSEQFRTAFAEAFGGLRSTRWSLLGGRPKGVPDLFSFTVTIFL